MNRVEEVEAKLDRVRTWLGSRSLDGVVLGSQTGFAWITAGGDNHVALGDAAGVASVLVTPGGAWLLSDNIEGPRMLAEEVAGLPLEPVEWPWVEPGSVAAAVARLCPGDRVASDTMAHGLPPADGVDRLRRALLPPEVDRYRAVARDTATALEDTCHQARPGDREREVSAVLALTCRTAGILDLVNLVAADDRIASYRHPVPTAKRVERTLLVAVVGRRHGLHASASRMVTFAPPDDDLVDRHRAVGRVDARLILESRPGRTLGQVMAAGMAQYAEEGFADEWRLHHQGGLTGYAGREVFATPESPDVLEADQVVAWNPSITRVKSEDTVLVTDGGPEVLTRTGRWPQDDVDLPSGVISRPALLQRGR
ncbi:MAG: M24 family metallopeptidase [Actinomycetota bacterium]|nr:M24 family metallopeptidase [Actinomycetota bacterium]